MTAATDNVTVIVARGVAEQMFLALSKALGGGGAKKKKKGGPKAGGKKIAGKTKSGGGKTKPGGKASKH